VYRLVPVPARARGPAGWTRGPKGHEALLDVDAGTIHYAAKLVRNPSRLRDAIVHEIAHAIVEGTGLRHWLKRLVKGKAARADRLAEIEETVIRFVVPAAIQALESVGLMERVRCR
jgi:phage-related minor tail protein